MMIDSIGVVAVAAFETVFVFAHLRGFAGTYEPIPLLRKVAANHSFATKNNMGQINWVLLCRVVS